MTSEALTHQRNLETSVLFLQQEHANTLKALHDEISKLQKKCSELTFELAMVSPETDKDNGNQTKRLESELDSTRKENGLLQQDSEKKDKRMKMLEQQLKAQERKFQDDVKAKNLTINTLKRELDSKSNNIAFLTTEMHRMKKRSSSGQENISENLNLQTAVPTPPKERVPRVRRTVHKKVESGAPGRRPIGGGSAHSRGTARSDSPVEVPDPTPFLQRSHVIQKEVLMKPAPPPLPPIAAQAIENARKGNGRVLFRSPRQDTRAGASHRAPVVPSPEVETLAVDQVPGTSSTGKWGRAHESKSSEYN